MVSHKLRLYYSRNVYSPWVGRGPFYCDLVAFCRERARGKDAVHDVEDCNCAGRLAERAGGSDSLFIYASKWGTVSLGLLAVWLKYRGWE